MPTEKNTVGLGTTEAERVVRDSLNAVGPTADSFWSSFDRFFDHQTVWENVGVSRTVGREEAVRFAQNIPVQFDHMRIADLTLSADGNRVYAERLDHFCQRDGSIIITIAALGYFEVRDGKIAFWRDYFDTAGFAAAVSAQRSVEEPRPEV